MEINIPNDHLITISNKDAYTERACVEEGAVFSDQRPFYSSSDDLLDATKYFNEIAIIREMTSGKKPGNPIFQLQSFAMAI